MKQHMHMHRPACEPICIAGDGCVHVDLCMAEEFSVAINGHMKNQCGCPVCGVPLCLVKACENATEVARCVTGDDGYFEFCFHTTDCRACYNIIPMEKRCR